MRCFVNIVRKISLHKTRLEALVVSNIMAYLQF